MWAIENRYGVRITTQLFDKPIDADNYIQLKCGGSKYLRVVRLGSNNISSQTKLNNFEGEEDGR